MKATQWVVELVHRVVELVHSGGRAWPSGGRACRDHDNRVVEPVETTGHGGEGMYEELQANAEGVDFALVAYREDGAWQVRELEAETAADLGGFATELRRYPGESGSLGMLW